MRIRFFTAPSLFSDDRLFFCDAYFSGIGLGTCLLYTSKDNSLTGEAVRITILDTFVAIMAGIIIFPACFAFTFSNIRHFTPLRMTKCAAEYRWWQCPKVACLLYTSRCV